MRIILSLVLLVLFAGVGNAQYSRSFSVGVGVQSCAPSALSGLPAYQPPVQLQQPPCQLPPQQLPPQQSYQLPPQQLQLPPVYANQGFSYGATFQGGNYGYSRHSLTLGASRQRSFTVRFRGSQRGLPQQPVVVQQPIPAARITVRSGLFGRTVVRVN